MVIVSYIETQKYQFRKAEIPKHFRFVRNPHLANTSLSSFLHTFVGIFPFPLDQKIISRTAGHVELQTQLFVSCFHAACDLSEIWKKKIN